MLLACHIGRDFAFWDIAPHHPATAAEAKLAHVAEPFNRLPVFPFRMSGQGNMQVQTSLKSDHSRKTGCRNRQPAWYAFKLLKAP